MFFRPTPSKLEQARRAARRAAHNAGDAVQNALGDTLGGARNLVAAAPHVVSNAAEAVTHAAQGAGEAISGLLHPGASSAKGVDDVADAAQKAQSAKHAAELATRQAERAARDADKAAQSQLERARHDVERKRAEFDAEQAHLEARAEELAQARRDAQARAAEVAAIPDYDDYADEPRVVVKEGGTSKLWLLVGAAVFVGAAFAYFFKSSAGRRSRAAIKDRLAKVKDNAPAKFEPATNTPAPSHAAAPSGATERDGKMAEVLERFSTPTESAITAQSAPAAEEAPRVETYEPLGHLETTGATTDEEVPHPNVFDKVAKVVGKAAGAAEHLAGEAAVHAHQTEVAPDAAK